MSARGLFPASLLGLVVLAAAPVNAEVVIVSPPDGAVVPPDFVVKVTFDDVYFGDTDFRGFVKPDTVMLYSEGEGILGTCDQCPSYEVGFDVTLEPGQHVLSASSQYSYVLEYSESITITVEEPASSSSGTAASTGAGETAGVTGSSSDAAASTGAGETAGVTGSTSTGEIAGVTGTTGDTSTPAVTAGCSCSATGGAAHEIAWLGAVCLAARRRSRKWSTW